MKKENMKVSMKVSGMFYSIYCAMCCLLLLPGCGKVVDWVNGSFQQISSVGAHCEAAAHYIKSITEYDQFTTAAKFDALWLSNEVRMVYVDLFGLKFGKTDEQKKALLRRQLEENNHFISFYVLSLYECTLGDPHSAWTLFLTIDNKNYAPIEVKVVKFFTKYTFIFRCQFNNFYCNGQS